jgi:hypothetical protein
MIDDGPNRLHIGLHRWRVIGDAEKLKSDEGLRLLWNGRAEGGRLRLSGGTTREETVMEE